MTLVDDCVEFYGGYSSFAPYPRVAITGDGDLDLVSSSENQLLVDVNKTYSHLTARAGSVGAGGGAVENVLFVNGGVGEGEERLVRSSIDTRISVEVRPPSTTAGLAFVPFVIYGWTEMPRMETARILPYSLGDFCMPSPLMGGEPQPAAIWNSAGRVNRLGRGSRPDPGGAPAVISSFIPGLEITVFFQGLIYDPGSSAEIPASVTNGVVSQSALDAE